MVQHPDSGSDSKAPILKQEVVAGREDPSDQFSPLTALTSYALCCATFIVAISRVRNFWEMSRSYGDNAAYLTIAQATLEWRFAGPDLQAVRQFYRGTGYCIALASKLTSLPAARCLPLLALICGAIAVYLCGRLWGWRVAVLFSFVNIAYTQRLCLGGCEAFFVVFLFVSLWLWRRERAVSAIACAALATTIRPTGVFLLLPLAAVLVWHRRWRDAVKSAVAVTVLGALYLAPIAFAARDPWAPVNGYADDYYGSWPVSVPFYPLLRGALTPGMPWTSHLKIGFYILLTLFGVITIWKHRRRVFANPAGQAESAFFLLFAGFCVSFNAWGAYPDYPRYSAPLVPQSVLDLRSRLFKAWVMLSLSVVAGLASAASALNVRAVFHMLIR
jgi:hypothetical protein